MVLGVVLVRGLGGRRATRRTLRLPFADTKELV